MYLLNALLFLLNLTLLNLYIYIYIYIYLYIYHTCSLPISLFTLRVS